jgi:hypothetical protein
MRAILIDPWKKSLETIDVMDGHGPEALQQMHALIGCEYFEACTALSHLREVIYVDDRGALQKPPLPYFTIPGYGWPIHGRAIVLGYSRDGSERSTKLTVDVLSRMITFGPTRHGTAT